MNTMFLATVIGLLTFADGPLQSKSVSIDFVRPCINATESTDAALVSYSGSEFGESEDDFARGVAGRLGSNLGSKAGLGVGASAGCYIGFVVGGPLGAALGALIGGWLGDAVGGEVGDRVSKGFLTPQKPSPQVRPAGYP